MPPPNPAQRKSSRKWSIVLIAIGLIAVLVGIALLVNFGAQNFGHYETGNLLASSLPQTTGTFTMSTKWALNWWFPTVTGNETLSNIAQSKLVIVIYDAETNLPVQTVVGYLNVDPQYQTITATGTFYLSITSPNHTANDVWYFRVTCSTSG